MYFSSFPPSFFSPTQDRSDFVPSFRTKVPNLDIRVSLLIGTHVLPGWRDVPHPAKSWLDLAWLPAKSSFHTPGFDSGLLHAHIQIHSG